MQWALLKSGLASNSARLVYAGSCLKARINRRFHQAFLEFDCGCQASQTGGNGGALLAVPGPTARWQALA